MELNEIISAVSTVGFPIAMCILIYYQDNKKIEGLKEAVNNNTTVLKIIMNKFGIDTGANNE